MTFANVNEVYSAAVQAQLRKTIIQSKQQMAITKGSLLSGEGARNESGQLTGLEIPYKKGVPQSETALDPVGGVTSFNQMTVPQNSKMYVGLTFHGFTVEREHFHEMDARRGKLPETSNDLRDQLLLTYMQHHNWYAIGKGDGALAVFATGGGGSSGVRTFANDATDKGRSKGSLRLQVSWSTTAGKRVMYQSVTKSTGTITSTFYITAKTSNATATIVVTDAGTAVDGDIVVKYGHYNKVPYGMGYHFDYNSRIYQGANTAVDDFLNSKRVNGGAALVTPTLFQTAKGGLKTRANNANARKGRVAHMSVGNYEQLAIFGYTLRQYNAEKGEANTTFGLPNVYEDEDTVFIQDADFEDAYIYLRDRKSIFEYRHSEMTEISEGVTQYVGTNLVGSTEKYQNWGEAYNIAYDMRGDDGTGKSGKGAPNSSVVIDNLTIPAISQMAEGLSLV